MTIEVERIQKYARTPLQITFRSADDILDFVRDINAIAQELLYARAEIMRLKAKLAKLKETT